MKANVYDKGRATDMPQFNESGKPMLQKAKTSARSGAAGWLVVAALLVLSIIPLVAGAFRLTELASGAAVTLANARFFASPLPVVAVTCQFVPLPLTPVIVALLTLLAARMKSVASTPVTSSLKITSQLTLGAFVGLGSARPMAVTSGVAGLKVTVLSVLVEAWLMLPELSCAAPAATVAMTVPGPVMPLTLMV